MVPLQVEEQKQQDGMNPSVEHSRVPKTSYGIGLQVFPLVSPWFCDFSMF